MIKVVLTGLCSLALLAGVALMSAGCVSDIKVKKSWKAPEVGSIQFSKVFVLVVAANDMNRKLAENAVLGEIKKVPNVASYEVLPDVTDLKNKAKVLQAIKDSGADGLIVLRMVYTDMDVTLGATQGVPMDYAIFSDYWGTVYDVGAFYAQDRRQVYTERIYGIETNIYDAKTQKLVWSGQTQSKKETHEDHDVQGILMEVAAKIKSTLQSQKLLR